ncbi:MAG: outer membrane lipoprotein-sorting protein, partial [Nitrospinae bacterium]|nr:outer membrane lipoprotein-sorting protein [Nitrospinota bacterium]
HRLMFFEGPADVRDTGFLTYDYDDSSRDDDQWLYLPALKKTKRIATADKSGSFMGSDFSYADQTKPDLTDYDYELVKEDEVRGAKVWIVMATPRTQAIIDEYGYTKSALFVRQDNHVVVRAKRWLVDGGREKYMDVVDLRQIDGIWTNLEITMTTKRGKETESKTILKQSEVSYGNALDPDLFTIRRLEKGL